MATDIALALSHSFIPQKQNLMTMRKNGFLIASFLLFSLSLSAQFTGRWRGEVKKDGKNTSFVLDIKNDGRFTLAYDLNPNDVSVKGRFVAAANARSLSFKTASGDVRLTKVNAKEPYKDFHLTFKKNNKSITYRVDAPSDSNPLKDMSILFGWDQGVAAVLLILIT